MTCSGVLQCFANCPRGLRLTETPRTPLTPVTRAWTQIITKRCTAVQREGAHARSMRSASAELSWDCRRTANWRHRETSFTYPACAMPHGAMARRWSGRLTSPFTSKFLSRACCQNTYPPTKRLMGPMGCLRVHERFPPGSGSNAPSRQNSQLLFLK